MTKPMGHCGKWTAQYEGQDIPCIHVEYLREGHYHDATLVPGGHRKGDSFVAAIEAGRKVLVTRGVEKRQAYLSLATVGPVTFDQSGLRFDVSETVRSFA